MTDDYTPTEDDWQTARLAIGSNGRFAYLDGKDEWRLIAPSGAEYAHVSSEGMRKRPGWHPIDPSGPSTMLRAAWETAERTSADNPARKGDTVIVQDVIGYITYENDDEGVYSYTLRVLKRAPRDPETTARDAARKALRDAGEDATHGYDLADIIVDAYLTAKGGQS